MSLLFNAWHEIDNPNEPTIVIWNFRHNSSFKDTLNPQWAGTLQ